MATNFLSKTQRRRRMATRTPSDIREEIQDNLEHLYKLHSTDPDVQGWLLNIQLAVSDLHMVQQAQERLIVHQARSLADIKAQRDELAAEMTTSRAAHRRAAWQDARRNLARALAAKMEIEPDALWAFLEHWASGDEMPPSIADEVETLAETLALIATMFDVAEDSE